MEHNSKKDMNMKPILCIFEQLSSLKINFHNRDIFILERRKRWRISISNSLVVWLVLYLLDSWVSIFITTNYEKTTEVSWGLLWEEVGLLARKVAWYGDRYVLINHVFTSLMMSLLSLLKILKGILKMRYFYGSTYSEKCRTSLALYTTKSLQIVYEV
jgi:hypothetical protein